MPDNKPGEGFLGWLGRQVGHVKNAIKTDVARPAQPVSTPQPPLPPPQSAAEDKQVIYRAENAQEIPHPEQPGVILRRTVIDEVIVDPLQAPKPGDTPPA